MGNEQCCEARKGGRPDYISDLQSFSDFRSETDGSPLMTIHLVQWIRNHLLVADGPRIRIFLDISDTKKSHSLTGPTSDITCLTVLRRGEGQTSTGQDSEDWVIGMHCFLYQFSRFLICSFLDTSWYFRRTCFYIQPRYARNISYRRRVGP